MNITLTKSQSLMCICTRMGIHVHATARRSHTSPTCNGQPINRQLSVPAYAQAHAPVHLHTRKHTHPHSRVSHPSPALRSVVGSKSFLTSMLQQLGAGANAERNVRAGAALECQAPAGGVVRRECLLGNTNPQSTHRQALAQHAVAAHTRLRRGARALRGRAHPTTTRRTCPLRQNFELAQNFELWKFKHQYSSSQISSRKIASQGAQRRNGIGQKVAAPTL
jgi:hypothetical protein